MIYSIVVKPHSKKGPLVTSTGENTLTVYLREKPIDGEANQALIKVLSEYFQLPKACISIKTGVRGRQKLVEIQK